MQDHTPFTALRRWPLAVVGIIGLAGAATAQGIPPQVRMAPQVSRPAAGVPITPPPFMAGTAPTAQPTINPPSAQATEAPVPAAGSVAEPATTPAPAKADGTAPGNDGSTGWTGGTGGSTIGTTPQGAVAASKTWQPPTARGLDLMGVPDAVAKP